MLSRSKIYIILALLTLVNRSLCNEKLDLFVLSDASSITGEFKKWHKVTPLSIDSQLSETEQLLPFEDYRLNVIFTRSSSAKFYTISGFCPTDGYSTKISAKSGKTILI